MIKWRDRKRKSS